MDFGQTRTWGQGWCGHWSRFLQPVGEMDPPSELRVLPGCSQPWPGTDFSLLLTENRKMTKRSMLTPVQWSSQDASDGKGSASKTLQVGTPGLVPGAGSPHDAGFSSLLVPELALPRALVSCQPSSPGVFHAPMSLAVMCRPLCLSALSFCAMPSASTNAGALGVICCIQTVVRVFAPGVLSILCCIYFFFFFF